MLVYCKDLQLKTFYVNYSSPYSAGWEGGFVAIPELESEILIAQTDGKDSDWYYLGSIFGPKEGGDAGPAILEAREAKVPDKEIYRARQVPQRLLMQDPMGNKLVLSHAYNPKYFNVKAELQSSFGKVLSLVDSPKIDSILLKNEHGDGIKITSSKQEMSAAGS